MDIYSICGELNLLSPKKITHSTNVYVVSNVLNTYSLHRSYDLREY